jgi:voltage-gated potassium channel
MLRLPRKSPRPLVAILERLGLAVGLILFGAAVVYLGRDGHVDDAGGPISFLDAVYYASVTVTTTGYGDITPVTDTARLVTTLIVTPARVLFLVLLVGTTLEILTERTREEFRERRWRARMEDHYVICGYGAKGRGAIHALTGRGIEPERILVVDRNRDNVEEANLAGFASIHGDATRTAVLREAGVDRAAAVIIAPHTDDASALITLTAREINPAVEIVASVREIENVSVVRQSGADVVITSSEASGRLLGIATHHPRIIDVVEQLLAAGEGFDLAERPVAAEEVGRSATEVAPDQLVLAIVRSGQTLPFTDARTSRLREGDRLLVVQANGDPDRDRAPLEE